MKKYKQLNLEEHVTIKVLLQQGKSKRAIARYLGRNPSTIHREICRGITLDGTYFAESTEGLIRQRKLNDKRKRKMAGIGFIVLSNISKKKEDIFLYRH